MILTIYFLSVEKSTILYHCVKAVFRHGKRYLLPNLLIKKTFEKLYFMLFIKILQYLSIYQRNQKYRTSKTKWLTIYIKSIYD